jgi:tetratricopeptide (TPR) repeat protein
MPVWLDRLEREHDNFRAALGWSQSERDELELGLRLTVALVRFWEMHGYFTEGRRWLEVLVARRETAPPLLRAAALNAAGILAYRQGDYPRVSEYCSEALTLCEAHADDRGAGRALHFLAHVMQAQGNYAAATQMMERSVALHRAAGDAADLANSVDCLGEIARSAGDDAGARARTEEALALYRDLGHVRGQAHALHNLAYVQLHEGDSAGARALFRESLILVRSLGTKRDQAFALAGLACASLDDADGVRVTRLLSAAAAALSTIEVRLEPAEHTEFQRAVGAMRARLAGAEFALAWAEGRAMTLEQTIEYALAGEETRLQSDTHRAV